MSGPDGGNMVLAQLMMADNDYDTGFDETLCDAGDDDDDNDGAL